jgi:hypothetical protein
MSPLKDTAYRESDATLFGSQLFGCDVDSLLLAVREQLMVTALTQEKRDLKLTFETTWVAGSRIGNRGG